MAEPSDLLTWECPTFNFSTTNTTDPRDISNFVADWNLPLSYKTPDNWLSVSGSPDTYQPSEAVYDTKWSDLDLATPVSAVSAIALNEIYEQVLEFEKTAILSGFIWDEDIFPIIRAKIIEVNDMTDIRSAIDDLSGKLICFADYLSNNIMVDELGAWCSSQDVTDYTIDYDAYCSGCNCSHCAGQACSDHYHTSYCWVDS